MPLVFAGRYRLDALIRPDLDPGAWNATDLTSERPVLVCLVSKDTGAAAQARKTQHAGLVPILDAGRASEGLFVVLPRFEGDTLEEIVRLGGALEPAQAVRLVAAAADALAALRAADEAHGGVTPLAFDVLDLEQGRVRLGLAGVQDTAIAYQSPTRLTDGGASAHDDAWALLACLYFAVTGGPPFEAETAGALARRVLGGRPLPIKATTPAEQALRTMFERGFARTATPRYPDVLTLREDLRAWLAAHAPPPAASTPPPARISEAPEVTTAALHEEEEPRASVEPAPAVERVATPSHAPSEPHAVVASEAPPKRAASDRRVPMAFAVGGLLAVGAAVVLVQRPRVHEAEVASPMVTAHATSAPVHAAPPPAATSAVAARASASAPAPSVSASAPPADLDACVAGFFPPESFDPDTNLSFLCSEQDWRRGTGGLHRAVVAGGKGKKITEAMHEWPKLGWFELPVYATLRARCCPAAAPIEVPRVIGSSCPPAGEALHALAMATATSGDVDGAIRAYRKVVACLVEHGDFPAYGQKGPIGEGEEPAFRAFAERGRKR